MHHLEGFDRELYVPTTSYVRWAEAPIKIARMTLTIKLDGNWSSFQLANNTPPLSVTGSVIAPSARMLSLNAFDAHMVSTRAWQCLRVRLHSCNSCGRAGACQLGSQKNPRDPEPHPRDPEPFMRITVTPKGALRLAICNASATRKGL